MKQQSVEAMMPLIYVNDLSAFGKQGNALTVLESVNLTTANFTGVSIMTAEEEKESREFLPKPEKFNHAVAGTIKISSQDKDSPSYTDVLWPYGKVDGQFLLLTGVKEK